MDEKFPDEPSISLGALVKPEKIPPKATEPEKISSVGVTIGSPSLDLGTLIQAQPKPRLAVRKSAPRSESYTYNCSDCGTVFRASVKLDPSRSLYCENCLEKIRAKRREETGQTTPTAPRPAMGGSSSEEEKKKRKRKRKKSVDVPPVTIPLPPHPAQEQTGTLRTGQTIRFD